MDDPTKDLIPRSSIEYYLRKEIVSTNPDVYEAHEKFIAYMDDPEISQFGRWMCSNGINTALVAIEVDLGKIPSVQPERKTFSSMADIEFEKWLYVHGICHPDVCESIPCRIVPLLIDDAINELLSAQSEQKVGRWVDAQYPFSKCSICECYFDTANNIGNFCPCCGAKMEVTK